LLLALAMVSARLAQAHDPGLSVASARLESGTLLLHVAMSRVDADRLGSPLSDQQAPLGEGRDVLPKRPASSGNGRLGGASLPQLEKQARAAFVVTCDGRPLKLTKATVGRENRDGVHFDLAFPGLAGGRVAIRSALLGAMPRGHRQFISLQDQQDHRLAEQMLDVGHCELTAELTGQEPLAATPHSFREFLCLGVEHIATGYDHLLFLLGLLIVGGSLRAALKIITSFTLAHSITLALATLNIINIPPKVIEPLIAASIIFVGLQNILRPDAGKRWLLTFGFGLIHGCGFASALRDLGIGNNGSSIAVPLLSFNLGVELGQLAVAAVALPLIWKCRASPVFVQRWAPFGSAMIVAAGGYWLVERTVL
jgi:hydrogenase/urease accessory protein HupE